LSKEGCVDSIYKYNTTSSSWNIVDYVGGAWIPVGAAENFSKLEAGVSYYFENSEECNITYAGIINTENVTFTLPSGYSTLGWYSPRTESLPQGAGAGTPIPTSPSSCVVSMHRYDRTEERFQLTEYYDGWGWWAPPQDSDFTTMEPGRGYWIETNQECTWEHDPQE